MSKYIMSNIWGGKPGNTPGIGHQFRLWMVGYTAAEKYDCIFVNETFKGNHTQTYEGVGRIDVPVSKWNDFLNFGSKELIRNDLPYEIQTIQLPLFDAGGSVMNDSWSKIINSKYDNDILFKCPFNHFTRMHWDIYKNNRFKQKYWTKRLQNPIYLPFDNDKINVAVHIRRCDVTQAKYPDRFLPNIYYRKIIEYLLSLSTNIDIHIYSDAKNIDEFMNLRNIPNTFFHIRDDVFNTFHAFVSADIFVTSIGSFSILASYLSKGLKLTTQWNNAWNRFPSDCSIINVQRDGKFNMDKVKEYIREMSK